MQLITRLRMLMILDNVRHLSTFYFPKLLYIYIYRSKSCILEFHIHFQTNLI